MVMGTGLGEQLSLREEAMRARLYALQRVDEIINGDATATAGAPWQDPIFQGAVLQRLRDAETWRRDAEKLAIVKEVFGGAK